MGRKQPKVGKQVQSGKDVRTAADADMNWANYPITWHFRYLDVEGPFGWHVCDRATLVSTIMGRAKAFETMTWRELRNQSMLHSHSLQSIAPEARERLAHLKQDVVEHIHSLRIDGRRRVWGIQDRLYFRV